MTNRAYLNEFDAAHFLGLAPKTLSRWRWAKKGPRVHKFSGAIRYAVVDLEAFAADAVVTS
jgi:hypothetical protein